MRKWVLIGAAAALLSGAGCRKRNQDGATRTSEPQQVGPASGGRDYSVTPGSSNLGDGTSATERVRGGTPTTGQGDAPADLQLSGSVQEVVMESALQEYGPVVTVTTRNGVVTLRGTVKTEADKQALSNIVKSIEGVRTVSNQLQVAPVPSSASHHQDKER